MGDDTFGLSFVRLEDAHQFNDVYRFAIAARQPLPSPVSASSSAATSSLAPSTQAAPDDDPMLRGRSNTVSFHGLRRPGKRAPPVAPKPKAKPTAPLAHDSAVSTTPPTSTPSTPLHHKADMTLIHANGVSRSISSPTNSRAAVSAPAVSAHKATLVSQAGSRTSVWAPDALAHSVAKRLDLGPLCESPQSSVSHQETTPAQDTLDPIGTSASVCVDFDSLPPPLPPPPEVSVTAKRGSVPPPLPPPPSVSTRPKSHSPTDSNASSASSRHTLTTPVQTPLKTPSPSSPFVAPPLPPLPSAEVLRSRSRSFLDGPPLPPPPSAPLGNSRSYHNFPITATSPAPGTAPPLPPLPRGHSEISTRLSCPSAPLPVTAHTGPVVPAKTLNPPPPHHDASHGLVHTPAASTQLPASARAVNGATPESTAKSLTPTSTGSASSKFARSASGGRAAPPPAPPPPSSSSSESTGSKRGLLCEIRDFNVTGLKKSCRVHRRHNSGGWGSVKRVIESKRAFINNDSDSDSGGFSTAESED